MMEAVRAWEEAYTLEPSNLHAREFLRSALERIHAHMAPPAAPQQAAHPWLPPPATRQQVPADPARKSARIPSDPSLSKAKKTKAKAPPPESPWDDGPSMAIQQDTPPPGAEAEAGGAWTIHQEPMPVPPAEDDELSAWVAGARELVALNDFSGALELMAKKTKAKAPPPESPWDDGPSMAIQQDTPPPGAEAEAGGAWTIHQEPMPVPPAEDDELSAWVAGARELVALNDFSGALELLAK